MKALSIRQPWAWLIVNGYKPVENRSWWTNHRGPFLVHAGLRIDREAFAWVAQRFPEIRVPDPSRLEVGGIVGQASVVGCVDRHPSPWFFGPVGFLLDEARPVPFIPLKGRLGFFESGLPETVEERGNGE